MIQAISVSINHMECGDWEQTTEVVVPTLVTNVGTYGRTVIQMMHAPWNDDTLTDSGMNCCMTNNWKLLGEIKTLSDPVKVRTALESNDEIMVFSECRHL